MDLTVRVVCTESFYGPNCNMFCTENCTCPPGLTGEFCATNIDDCVGVDCGDNQRCVDGVNSHTCECEAGYTGADCLTDIDECEGVNCNGGTCEQGTASFMCECPPQHTGQFCETLRDSYQLQVTFHSFDNPEGRCADMRCRIDQMCCNGRPCPNSCEYYFSLCLREANAPVSMEFNEGQGGCSAFEAFETEPRLIESTTTFVNTVFGVSNPIIFGGRQWVSV